MVQDYFETGAARAQELGNRGPLAFDDDGHLKQEILDRYRQTGFFVFEGVIAEGEMNELVTEYEAMLEQIPTGTGARTDRHGRPAIGLDYQRPAFRFVKPLTDPHGGTDIGNGRYQARMTEPDVPEDAPDEVLLQINGTLHFLESALRLYGNPRLLSVAEAINGPDFTPFTDTIWVKPGGLGASVAWHQDGTTRWNDPGLDGGTHGFNFMTNLYPTDPRSSLWVVPETHDIGKIDIKALVAENGGSDQLPNAVPMLCEPGDVAICNRQALHGSFANVSPNTRATYVFGFHRRASVLNTPGWGDVAYDEARIHERSRIIALAIDARAQHFPDELPYLYQPLADEMDANRWGEQTRKHLLHNYNLNDLGI